MTYTVRPGDNLTKIANQYGTTVDAILAVNPQITNANLIRPGDKITIPVSEPQPDPIADLTVRIERLEQASSAQAEQIADLTMRVSSLENEEPEPEPEPEPSGDDLDSLGRPPAGKLLLGVEEPAGGWTRWLTEAGQAPHIWHQYNDGEDFTEHLAACPVGTIPLMNFKPTGDMGAAEYQKILNGQANAAIDRAADAVKAYKRLVFVAPLHEPENDDTTGASDANYARAWRFIVERMKARGATNGVYVWNVMGAAVHGSRYATLYPGDDIVDWIAWDPYIQTSEVVDTWAEFLNLHPSQAWPGFYKWATTNHPGKPLMLAEFGIGQAVVPTTPSKLFGDTQMAALVRDLPAMKALVYWNEEGKGEYRVSHPNWTGQGATGLLGKWVRRPEFQVGISETAKP